MLKISLTVLIIIFQFGTNIYAQENRNPKYVYNSVEINTENIFISPLSIDSIKVDKYFFPNGKISMFSSHDLSNFITVQEVIFTNTEIEKITNNLIIKINGKIVNEISNIKIDNNLYQYVTLEKTKNIEYLDEKYRNIIIINIDLEFKKRKPNIIIRGSDNYLELLYPKQKQ